VKHTSHSRSRFPSVTRPHPPSRARHGAAVAFPNQSGRDVLVRTTRGLKLGGVEGRMRGGNVRQRVVARLTTASAVVFSRQRSEWNGHRSFPRIGPGRRTRRRTGSERIQRRRTGVVDAFLWELLLRPGRWMSWRRWWWRLPHPRHGRAGFTGGRRCRCGGSCARRTRPHPRTRSTSPRRSSGSRRSRGGRARPCG
jgi:hypothetical protein